MTTDMFDSFKTHFNDKVSLLKGRLFVDKTPIRNLFDV